MKKSCAKRAGPEFERFWGAPRGRNSRRRKRSCPRAPPLKVPGELADSSADAPITCRRSESGRVRENEDSIGGRQQVPETGNGTRAGESRIRRGDGERRRAGTRNS